MNLFRSLYVASFLGILTAVSAGCGSDTTEVVDDGKAVSSLEITPGITSLTKGETVKFNAIAKFADGSTEDVSTDKDTVWNTSDPDVATVADDGTVTAVDKGSVDITADYQRQTAEESFVVVP